MLFQGGIEVLSEVQFPTDYLAGEQLHLIHEGFFQLPWLLCMAIKFCKNVGLIITSLEGDAEVLQQFFIWYVSTTEVQLELDLVMGAILSLVLYQLDHSLVMQFVILDVDQYICMPGPED